MNRIPPCRGLHILGPGGGSVSRSHYVRDPSTSSSVMICFRMHDLWSSQLSWSYTRRLLIETTTQLDHRICFQGDVVAKFCVLSVNNKHVVYCPITDQSKI